MSDKIDQQGDSLDWIKGTGNEPDEDVEQEPVSGDIVLEGSLGIAEAEAMHQTFASVLQANVDISIQSEALSRVDSAGTQLLYAFVKEAKQCSITLKWLSVSDVLKESAAALGLTDGMGFEDAGA
ncbi:MAG: lipid asymmetry maintenance protein MlaB [Mariprofundus sp.]